MSKRIDLGLVLVATLSATACGFFPDQSPSSGRVTGTFQGAPVDCPLDADRTEFHEIAGGGFDVTVSACDGRFVARGHLREAQLQFANVDGVYPLPDCVLVASATTATVDETDGGTPETDGGTAEADGGSTDGGSDVAVVDADGTWMCAGGDADADGIVDGFELLADGAHVALDASQMRIDSTDSFRLAGKLTVKLAEGAALDVAFNLREALELEPHSSGGGGHHHHHH